MTYNLSKWIYPEGIFWRIFQNGYLCAPAGIKYKDNKFKTAEEAVEATINIDPQAKFKY